MYLPLAALCALFVTSAAGICAERGGGAFKVFVMVGAVLALALFGSTFARSSVYADAGSIWEDTARKRPENPRAHDGVGAALLEKGDYDGAVKRFKASLEIENRTVRLSELVEALQSKRSWGVSKPEADDSDDFRAKVLPRRKVA